jgi:hypothetical protein
LPTRIIQTIVNAMQDSLLKAALDPNGSFTFPAFLGWPLVRKLPPLIFGFGIFPEHVKDEARREQKWSPVAMWIAGIIAALTLVWITRRITRRSS